ncbi:hypothetical protein CCMSSC00406_0002532 [Pleurotus cornucopiae]|uniref:Uncharacterized protein n=1 Tax=Pleurotus cornucopiae TaxID=5321 RepID=A0ACB7IRL3_PLECO|nr:hypothetical protein CCMSSC00406_0002532 [Pleurotus cornucopiae]
MTRPSTRSAGRRTATEPHTSLCFTERSPTKTSATPLISSPSSLVQVLDFSPPEGGWGTPVTVRIKVKHNALPALCTRLVFGHQAVNTAVQEFSAAGLAGWQLDAAIPRLASDAKIPMIVQVLDMNSKVIESLTFAEFTYRVSGKTNKIRFTLRVTSTKDQAMFLASTPFIDRATRILVSDIRSQIAIPPPP